MKIIEAMKTVKMNINKIDNLQKKIAEISAHLSHETPKYGNKTKSKLSEWVQSCHDIGQENIRLLCAIQRTNLATTVDIELGGKTVTKTIAEWVWRRRQYAATDLNTWSIITDKGLKEGVMRMSTGEELVVSIVRNYEPEKKDKMIEMYLSEPTLIDSKLEVVNAVTELIELN